MKTNKVTKQYMLVNNMLGIVFAGAERKYKQDTLNFLLQEKKSCIEYRGFWFTHETLPFHGVKSTISAEGKETANKLISYANSVEKEKKLVQSYLNSAISKDFGYLPESLQYLVPQELIKATSEERAKFEKDYQPLLELIHKHLMISLIT